MRRPRRSFIAMTAAAILLTGSVAATAQQPDGRDEPAQGGGLTETGDDYNDGKPVPLDRSTRDQRPPFSTQSADGYEVGDEQQWLALDDANGIIYFKDYTLRGVGDNIEVWVASDSDDTSTDLDFPEGDCRNGVRTEVTDAQVDHLIGEFDGNIYPKESEAFSVPPARDGSGALIGDAGMYAGEGDNIVVLVDNVRDANFYDTDNQSELSYIAGFHYSLFNEYHDRNIMSIDGFDWLHRTGENPPNEPTDDPCTSAPARPLLYEGVFAHEYQHLLEYYEDPDETTWVNEGLSDWAQTLTGYVDPSIPITEIGYDSHVQCFLGHLGVETDANPSPREESGPENSLTLWGDQGQSEILCDYGAVYTFMELLHGRYGTDFMSALHREDLGGLEGLQAQLDAFGTDDDARQVLHDWAAAMALDGVLDDGNGNLKGGDADDYTVPTLDATINWDTPEAYDTAGAPPNGSDYVRLRDDSGDYLSGRELRSVSFDGAETLAPDPVRWTVEPSPEGQADDPALYSGSGANFDRAIVTDVAVPEEDATLSFDTWFDIEHAWDYGFVQVSTDGGESWTSLGNDDTTSETEVAARATVQDNVPGFTGVSTPDGAAASGDPEWITTQFDLSEYAGQDIMLSFRYVTDPAVNDPGWYVDDVEVGGEVVSDGSSLDGFESASQAHPTAVDDFTVQLVSYADDGKHVRIAEVPLDASFDGSLSRGKLRRHVHPQADVVAAIVTFDDPSERASKYARYQLAADGVTQPGG